MGCVEVRKYRKDAPKKKNTIKTGNKKDEDDGDKVRANKKKKVFMLSLEVHILGGEWKNVTEKYARKTKFPPHINVNTSSKDPKVVQGGRHSDYIYGRR